MHYEYFLYFRLCADPDGNLEMKGKPWSLELTTGDIKQLTEIYKVLVESVLASDIGQHDYVRLGLLSGIQKVFFCFDEFSAQKLIDCCLGRYDISENGNWGPQVPMQNIGH